MQASSREGQGLFEEEEFDPATLSSSRRVSVRPEGMMKIDVYNDYDAAAQP